MHIQNAFLSFCATEMCGIQMGPSKIQSENISLKRAKMHEIIRCFCDGCRVRFKQTRYKNVNNGMKRRVRTLIRIILWTRFRWIVCTSCWGHRRTKRRTPFFCCCKHSYAWHTAPVHTVNAKSFVNKIKSAFVTDRQTQTVHCQRDLWSPTKHINYLVKIVCCARVDGSSSNWLTGNCAGCEHIVSSMQTWCLMLNAWFRIKCAFLGANLVNTVKHSRTQSNTDPDKRKCKRFFCDFISIILQPNRRKSAAKTMPWHIIKLNCSRQPTDKFACFFVVVVLFSKTKTKSVINSVIVCHWVCDVTGLLREKDERQICNEFLQNRPNNLHRASDSIERDRKHELWAAECIGLKAEHEHLCISIEYHTMKEDGNKRKRKATQAKEEEKKEP